MSILEYSKELSQIDDLEEWVNNISHIDKVSRRAVFDAAEPLWVERMIKNGKLLLHPEVYKELENNQWKPNDLHRKMIWASVLASFEGVDGKERFKSLKIKLIKKHGRDWWEDVYRRIKSTFAAKDRLRKNNNRSGPSTRMLASHSTILGQALNDERLAALRMIPPK